MASPLTHLLRKDVSFHWDSLQEKAFQDLKVALINAPVLAFPDYSLPFILYTDASSLGVGAVLMQHNVHGKHRPIPYASRRLTRAESNYSVTHPCGDMGSKAFSGYYPGLLYHCIHGPR